MAAAVALNVPGAGVNLNAAATSDGLNGEHTADQATQQKEDEFESGNSTAKLFERSRIRALAEEREGVQKKTFTKWVNSHLERAGTHVDDLYIDLRDGKQLLKLLEILSGDRLPRPTKGRMRIHCLENVDKSLSFLNEQKVHLENVGAHDIVDGNSRITLGLIWTIILRFQIQDILSDEFGRVGETSELRSAKDALLLWCQMKTAGYPNVNVRNFTNSWRDGLAFNAIIHKHRPDLIDYNKLRKENPDSNLSNAFKVADDRLGIRPLLDTQDVNTDNPDEKSIITYVATYYHYFSRLKNESVSAKRVGKVLAEQLALEKQKQQYEFSAEELLKWIENKIRELGDRTFPNTIPALQLLFQTFNQYRTGEKPPKFVDMSNLEIQAFMINSALRANNQRPFTPKDGYSMADVNSAWQRLERSEHERELALRDALISLERLEQLAARFERKAGMRETWLQENQRLVTQDNFGNDLATVEASTKKHEAIETDIRAYEERVHAVVAVADELQEANYHDIQRILRRKETVLQLWNQLLELLKARRIRLDSTQRLYHIFQEMIYLLDWIEELQNRLQSEDYGKHLMSVEDLLQKHALLEADIAVLGERVKTIVDTARKYKDGDPEADGFKPAEPAIIDDRIGMLESAYKMLQDAANARKSKLYESRRLWHLMADMDEEEQWIKETIQLMGSPDLGHDLTSVQALLNKHKALEDAVLNRQNKLQGLIQEGERLTALRNVGTDLIKGRIAELRDLWSKLIDAVAIRKKHLFEALAYYQFFSEADDIETWMVEQLRVVSDENTGHDEASVQSLLKKHEAVMADLEQYEKHIQDGLIGEYLPKLNERDRESPQVLERIAQVQRRYEDLLTLAKLRKQKLLDAASLHRLFREAENVEVWITEKEKLLVTIVPGEDVEELEILKQRFEGFEKELSDNSAKVDLVNEIANNLLRVENIKPEDITERQLQLKQRWDELNALAENKRIELDNAYKLRQFYIESQESTTWIKDKEKLIESTDELSNDLNGIMQLQRRLGSLQNDLAAIGAKVDSLINQGLELEKTNPDEAQAIAAKVNELRDQWEHLNNMLKERDERLHESEELQKFLQNLDHFQVWLSKTQTTIASTDLPNDVQEAEKMLTDHEGIKNEIVSYEPEYAAMFEFGMRVTEGQTDPQYVFLRQRLEALNQEWLQLHQMWEQRQNMLTQALNYQLYMRDAKQAEVMLNQQENYLSKEEAATTLKQATSPEQVENLIKAMENFITTMEANEDKIMSVVKFGERVIEEGNYASDRIKSKNDQLLERFKANRERAQTKLEKLKDQLIAQTLLAQCKDLEEWLSDKRAAAEDESYRGAKDIRTKFNRHNAFEREIAANRERLNKLEAQVDELQKTKPEVAALVQSEIDKIKQQWGDLDTFVKEKGDKLFKDNRGVIYDQNVDDVESWISQVKNQMVESAPPSADQSAEQQPSALADVENELKRQENLEKQLAERQAMIDQLHSEAEALRDLEPDRVEEIEQKKMVLQQNFLMLQAPLNQKRSELEKKKRDRQFIRDVNDELLWIDEKLPLAQDPNYGDSLADVLSKQKKLKSLKQEVDNHQPRIDSVCDSGRAMIEEGYPNADQYKRAIEILEDKWKILNEALDNRKNRLDQSEEAQRYLFEASEDEAWIREQLNVLERLAEQRPRDEQDVAHNTKKQENLTKTVDNYGDTKLPQLKKRAEEMIKADHPNKDEVQQQEDRLEKLYTELQQACNDRTRRLDSNLVLISLKHDIDDLEQWILDRTVIASSHELGQDLEHVTMLIDRFNEFSRETEAIGTERVEKANSRCKEEMAHGHMDSALIAEWIDRINELWDDLKELMKTRMQQLQASYDLHKFYLDCKETIERIMEKQTQIPEEVGRDSKSVTELQRKHTAFERELQALGVQVHAVQEDAARLLPAYSDIRERTIKEKRDEVLNAWRNLQRLCDSRRGRLMDTFDLYRFLALVRELTLWIEGVLKEMNAQERPKDVSGVQLLLSNHQSLKAEVDAREENFSICTNLGRNLLQRKHAQSDLIREKLTGLILHKMDMIEAWQERFDRLCLMLEVYQFAHDATVAECWLIAQEPYLLNQDLGETLDQTEALLKKHESFEKAAATQEDRFNALQKLTNFEVREQMKRPEDEERKRREREDKRKRAIAEFQPRPEPPPAPVQPTPAPAPATSPKVTTPTAAGPSSPMGPGLISTSSSQEEEVRQVAQPAVQHQPSTHTKPKPAVEAEPVPAAVTAAAAPATISGVTSDVHEEGTLDRKHEWEATGNKAATRSWNSLFIVLHGFWLYAYKDQKHAKQDPTNYFKQEPPIDLRGASAAPAKDYKKPNVFRLRLPNGAEYLFLCREIEDMNRWVSRINEAITAAGTDVSAAYSGAQKSRTLPAGAGVSPPSPGHQPQREASKGKADKKAGAATIGKKK